MYVNWLVIHTAAAERDGKPLRGITADKIRDWHVNGNGWSDIGYHYVVCDDGTVEEGRSSLRSGAHVKGLNSRSLGICVTGHGDLEDFNEAQYESIFFLCKELIDKYALDYTKVIGHKEVHTFTDAPNPHKTCPGMKVNMDVLRNRLRGYIDEIE